MKEVLDLDGPEGTPFVLQTITPSMDVVSTAIASQVAFRPTSGISVTEATAGTDLFEFDTTVRAELSLSFASDEMGDDGDEEYLFFG